MAETWSPNMLNPGAKPPGDGWVMTGTTTVAMPAGKFNSGFRKTQVPVYTRMAAPAPAPAPAPPPVPQPIQEAQAAIQQAQNREVAPYPDINKVLQDLLGIQAKDSADQAAAQRAAIDQQAAIQRQIQEQAAAERDALARQMAASQAQQQEQYNQQVASLNQLMVQQQSQYQAQLAQAQQQQAAAAAQAAESARQAQALQRAFVPNLEPTAAAPAIGDMRQSGDMGRRAAANTLSNLAILTGVGGSGPSAAVSTLAGLQIA